MHNEHDKATVSIDNLLNSLPEEVANLVRAKYDKDAEEFSEAAKAACPSQEPAYWAKKSCKRCCGRGVIGQKTVFGRGVQATAVDGEYSNALAKVPVKCACANRGYSRWLKDFRVEFNAAKKTQAAESAVTSEGNTNA